MNFKVLSFLALGIFATVFSKSQDIKGQKDNTQDKGYDPWYTGPLLAPSANNLPPGYANIQPYLWVNDIYGSYNSHRHEESIDQITNVSLESFIQFGLNDFLDLTFDVLGSYSHQNTVNVVEFSDVTVLFGIQLLKAKDYTAVPSIRLVIKEKFPTGRFTQLNPSNQGLDLNGTGAYQTGIGLNISKVVFWFKEHPMAFRLVASEYFPSTARVRNQHVFGGGHNTYGKIRPPYSFSSYLSFEFSFTQRWVFCFDTAYAYNTASSFSGFSGVNDDGSEASNTIPSSDLFALAPGLEYNFNENLGIVSGAYFSVYGRNTSAFATYIFSFTYTF